MLNVNNYSSRELTPKEQEALNDSQTELWFFSACVTNFLLHADAFVTQLLEQSGVTSW